MKQVVRYIAIIGVAVLLFPFNALAHYFWITVEQVQGKEQVRVCGGHNFPKCEFAPDLRRINVTAYRYEAPKGKAQIVSLAPFGNTLQGEFAGKEGKGFFYFLLRKKTLQRVIYCGEYVDVSNAGYTGRVKDLQLCPVKLRISGTQSAGKISMVVEGEAGPVTWQVKWFGPDGRQRFLTVSKKGREIQLSSGLHMFAVEKGGTGYSVVVRVR